MKCNSYQEACRYVESLIPKSPKWKFPGDLGIKRMKAVLKELDNPQDSFKSIHIAGTSGKGSTSYFVAKILQELGFRVGLHMSPHLQTIRERMIVNRHLVSEKEFVNLLNEVVPAIKKVSKQFKSSVTYFESLLAMTFLYFKKKKVDYAVIETGLGGTHDGTNVLNSLIAIITQIGFDHTNILGKTISEIASQKAGIIKKTNTACISQKQLHEAEAIIRKVAVKNNVPIFFEGNNYSLTTHSIKDNGCIFTYKDTNKTIKNISLPLLGKHQVNNAGAAIKATLELEKTGIKVKNNEIKRALSNAYFPGRIELLQLKNKKWVLDGAHNEDKISALISSLDDIFSKKNKIAIIGFKIDKDIDACLKILIPYFKTIVCTQFHTSTDMGKRMAIDPQQLSEKLIRLGFKGNIIVRDNIEKAVKYVNGLPKKNTICVVTGSLYLVGEARSALGLVFSV